MNKEKEIDDSSKTEIEQYLAVCQCDSDVEFQD